MYIPFYHLSYPFQNITDYIQRAVRHTLTNDLNKEDAVDLADTASIQTATRSNLIIFDWDDTIFPTFVIKKHYKERKLYNTSFSDQMNELVVCLKNVFQQMIKLYGSQNVIIVTNATYSWIYDNCSAFPAFKGFIQYLKRNNISIISAAADYGKLDTECRSKWKEFAFTDIFSKYFDNDSNVVNCITSIGDSLYEFNASKYACENVRNCILHRIKFKSKPSIDKIIDQMQTILSITNQFGVCTENMEIKYS